MRTSDAERQRVAEFLRDACGDGRLSPEELEERLDRRAAPRRVAVASVPARRRHASPAVPIGATLLVGGLAWLAFAALPPLLGILLGAIALSFAVVVLMFAVAMAPVGLMLFGIAWVVHRVFRGQQPHAWPGGRRGRHPFF